MTAVLLGSWPAGSEPWHAARARGLGGSEIAAVLGLSPFDSKLSLYHRKAGDVGPVEETNEMRWGKTLEPVIIAEFDRLHGDDWYIRPTGTWAHADRPWQLGNPDSLLYRDYSNGTDYPDSLLETKLSMFGDGWGETGTDQVPPHVRCQVIWYGDVLGLDQAHVCVFIASGLDVRTYRLTWDEAEARLLRDAGRAFLDDVAAGVRPDIDDHAATYQVIKELHPEIDGTAVEIPPGVAQAYIDAKATEKTTKAAAQQATSVLADHMGDARRATCEGRTIATRQARGDGLPYPVIARGLLDTATPTGPLVGATAATGADRFDLHPGESEF